ncbi:hypothetical protein HPULCUR_002830 [Helicostylum pulchrum]|uniref:Uncharacterized protein n=1 Tax=Helicostylum pulchrum TaxID=562976 RepID=A0ABP9XRQ4_9FUNG
MYLRKLRLHMQQVEINALRGSDNPSELETSFYFAHKLPLITQRNLSPENPTFHQGQNDTSPQNQTVT